MGRYSRLGGFFFLEGGAGGGILSLSFLPSVEFLRCLVSRLYSAHSLERERKKNMLWYQAESFFFFFSIFAIYTFLG